MLQPKETKQLVVSLFIAESPELDKIPSQPRYQPDLKRIKAALQEDAAQWLSRHTEIRSDSLLLNNVMERSLRDLRVLRSEIENQTFFAAGVPWFVTLFGRDSIVTALQTLTYEPAIAEQTLRLLASYQGQKLNSWRDEQPGKILHELRVGELARLGEIPHTPYYGTIDATVLFLILLGRHAAWTGSLVLFNDLKPRLVQSGHVAATRLVLLAVPAAFAVRYVPAWKNETLLFIITGIAIIPLAGWMGRGRR